MKKSLARLPLLLICLVLCVSIAAADSGENHKTDFLNSQEEVIENIHNLYSDDEFGGMYLEGNTLVINLVGHEGAAKDRAATDGIGNNVAVEYRVVKHPLRDIENVKDYLTQYMAKYGISALDANEVTNQVDVYLYDYNDSVIEEIEDLIADQYGEDIILNFIDKSGTEIMFTVSG